VNISLSVILPVTNETYSLKQTVDTISSSCGDLVTEYIIVTCDKTTVESMRTIEDLRKEHKEKIRVHRQQLPFLGGAIREAIDRCKGTHIVMMASDLETDPNLVSTFAREAQQNPEMIITATRWQNGGGFKGYNRFKLVFNYFFQKFFSSLYAVRLSDMTYGFRIFPASLMKSIRWEELRHPFLFETLLKPLRLGVPVKEIPSVWTVRAEGESQNTFLRNFEYFSIGLKVRFYDKRKILRS
jgi:hypothetical protein